MIADIMAIPCQIGQYKLMKMALYLPVKYERFPHHLYRSSADMRSGIIHQANTIVLPNGNTFKKRLTTKGFSFISEKRKEEPSINDECMDEPTL